MLYVPKFRDLSLSNWMAKNSKLADASRLYTNCLRLIIEIFLWYEAVKWVDNSSKCFKEKRYSIYKTYVNGCKKLKGTVIASL